MLYAFIDTSKLSIGNKIHAGMVAGVTDADIYWGLDEAGHNPLSCILKPITTGCVSAPAVVERANDDDCRVFIETETDPSVLTNSDMEFFSEYLVEQLSELPYESFDHELKSFFMIDDAHHIKPITYDDHCELQHLIRTAAKTTGDE